MDGLSANPNITLEFIKENPNGVGGEPWDMYELSRNPNITVEFIKENPNGLPASPGVAYGHPWDVFGLSMNTFDKIRKERKEIELKLQKKAKKHILYHAWYPYYYNPKHKDKGCAKDLEDLI